MHFDAQKSFPRYRHRYSVLAAHNQKKKKKAESSKTAATSTKYSISVSVQDLFNAQAYLITQLMTERVTIVTDNTALKHAVNTGQD